MEATNSVTAVRIQPLEDIISAVVSEWAVFLLQLQFVFFLPFVLISNCLLLLGKEPNSYNLICNSKTLVNWTVLPSIIQQFYSFTQKRNG